MPFKKGNTINKGRKFSKEHRERLSLSLKGKESSRKGVKLLEETKLKISKANKGKISPRKGAVLSEETKEKIRKANIGKKIPEKIKIKISQSLKGRKFSKKWKRKISESNKGREGGFKNKKHSIETIKKMSEAQKGEKGSGWKGGISCLPYSVDWTETLKRSIRERDNYICQICSQYGNNVHHIDYDKENCNPNNLITLCRSCHTKTNNNRKYWINYFFKKYE